MDQTNFPWRHLGSLLVDDELLSAEDLERALADQRRTGRLLGQILVGQGSMSATALTQALARQHGVELRSRAESDAEPVFASTSPSTQTRGTPQWRPLGRVLVDRGLLAESDLEAALAEKRQHPDRRLGEILVRLGHISGVTLAGALAEQHGIKLDTEALADTVETVAVPVPAGQPSYEVYAVEFPGGRRSRIRLYEGPNFLDAADFACDYIDREEPSAIEIEHHDAGMCETVWTYSRERAEAQASSGKALVETFGFDPARWNVRP